MQRIFFELMIVSGPPEAFGKYDQDGHNFQTAQNHRESQNVFYKIRQRCIWSRRSDNFADAGPGISNAGDDRAKRGDKVDAAQRNDSR